ncbi:hypothetical protein SCE1572_33855 [Sorangium cellulosum So0157-2]|uniref:Uncharacterized protein n=1 Tax=Sorangium cellulosum So0157-2 TaxID=1254432 RepID=S4Y0M4_SORCE|nr:hypothetical protein SCE1572_33855 [Sorangium cellulosum So0157-2]
MCGRFVAKDAKDFMRHMHFQEIGEPGVLNVPWYAQIFIR